MTTQSTPIYPVQTITRTRPYCPGYNVPDSESNVLCPDGKRRTVRYPKDDAGTTVWTADCIVLFRGKTVNGFVAQVGRDQCFYPYQDKKNGALFPKVMYVSDFDANLEQYVEIRTEE